MAEVCYLVYTSSMALSIKSEEADRLARELASETGETLTEAVERALRERLDREHARHGASMRTRLARLAADVAALRVADPRTAEEIIRYRDGRPARCRRWRRAGLLMPPWRPLGGRSALPGRVGTRPGL